MEFLKLSDTIGAGNTKNPQYRPMKQFLSCILVGVTGVGKTTLKNKLLEKYSFYPLPGRRTLTNRIILPLMQQNHGAMEPVNDRSKRFAYTKAYRKLHPGGMGYVLSKIRIKTLSSSTPVLFDGLRGVQEVKYAARALPSAFFIVLTAPDHLRIKRLINRQDKFDQAKGPDTILDKAEFEKICSSHHQAKLFDHVHKHGISKASLHEKARIVIKEKENYDQETTTCFLTETIPDRTFSLDSSQHSPGEIVAAIDKYLQNKKILITH